MRFRLRTRLGAAFMAVGIGSVVASGLLIDRTVRASAFEQVQERLAYEVTMTGQMMASALFAPLGPDDTRLDAPVGDLAKAVSTHLSVLTPEGVVVADSEGKAAPTPRHDAEVAEALAKGKGSAVRAQGGAPRLWVAETVKRDGDVLGVARASVPMAVVEAQAERVRGRVVLAGVLALVFSALSALLLAAGISRPVQRLAAASRRIGEGDLDVTVSEPQGDEIGELGAALNEMSASLRSMIGKLDARNRDMRRVLDTVDQGLVVVTGDGRLEGERSARIDTWFSAPAPGTPLWQLFAGAQESARDGIELAFRQLTQGFLPLEVCFAQLPTRIESGARCFDLAYTPIDVTEDCCTRLLVVITDTTQAMLAERIEGEQRDLLALMERALRDGARAQEFMDEATELMACVRSELPASEMKRALHTLKGNFGAMELFALAAQCHALESELEESETFPEDRARALSARFGALKQRVKRLAGRRADVVLSEAEVMSLVTRMLSAEPRAQIAQQLVKLTRVPVVGQLEELAARAKGLASRLHKELADVQVLHDGTCLERKRWTPFWSAFVHLVRNAVDHGIEAPEERERAGKPRRGRLTLYAGCEGDEFVVEAADDGRGIAWDALRKKLSALGLPADTEAALYEGLFMDGVSSRDEVSEVSGRGVGMGALRAVVHSLSGKLLVNSVVGQGARFRCVFPRVLAETGVPLVKLGATLASGVASSMFDDAEPMEETA
jgi:two-component system chemotaxis sensor kinase CheA